MTSCWRGDAVIAL